MQFEKSEAQDRITLVPEKNEPTLLKIAMGACLVEAASGRMQLSEEVADGFVSFISNGNIGRRGWVIKDITMSTRMAEVAGEYMRDWSVQEDEDAESIRRIGNEIIAELTARNFAASIPNDLSAELS